MEKPYLKLCCRIFEAFDLEEKFEAQIENQMLKIFENNFIERSAGSRGGASLNLLSLSLAEAFAYCASPKMSFLKASMLYVQTGELKTIGSILSF